uniref:Uncharacterized protein n=1 Tax=Lactuca sativa TaxID=4236 RepID=A0A9R1V9U8_LACSA|nr:hypothetical protein LSAT_V11C600328760 [Lactuca sativa]
MHKYKPILGMRFQGITRFKSMLYNYVVSNGYRLCYEKMIGKDCWLSVIRVSAHSDHHCARNYKLGSMVIYAWIGSHYTREKILLRKKMSVKKLRLAVTKKFGIHVSIG